MIPMMPEEDNCHSGKMQYVRTYKEKMDCIYSTQLDWDNMGWMDGWMVKTV